MEMVKAEFVGYEEANENAAGQAHGEAENIDKGECLFFKEVAEGEFKIVAEHGELAVGYCNIRARPGNVASLFPE